MWNREKDFQLTYGDMNLVLGNKNSRRITRFSRKGMEIFNDFVCTLYRMYFVQCINKGEGNVIPLG